MLTRDQCLSLLITAAILLAAGPSIGWLLDEVRRIKKSFRR